jgi:hypothetical protein
MDKQTGYGTNKEMELAEALETCVRTLTRANTILEGKVTEVDEDTYTCTVEVGDSQSSVIYDNVYFDVLITGQGSFICIPAVNSPCYLAFRDGSEDRRQLLKSFNNQKIIAAPTLWQFGTGSNGGVPMVNPLTEHLNTLENDRNNLKSAIAEWVPVPNDGGAALKVALATWLGITITPTETSDLANENVTQ